MRTLPSWTASILVLLAGWTRPAQAERPVRLSASSNYAWVKILRHVETSYDFEPPEPRAFWNFEGATSPLTDVDVSQRAPALPVPGAPNVPERAGAGPRPYAAWEVIPSSEPRPNKLLHP